MDARTRSALVSMFAAWLDSELPGESIGTLHVARGGGDDGVTVMAAVDPPTGMRRDVRATTTLCDPAMAPRDAAEWPEALDELACKTRAFGVIDGLAGRRAQRASAN